MVSAGDAERRQVWAARLARYRSSGLSVVRFCEQEGVSTNTFYYWAKRLAANPASSRGGRAAPPRRASATPATNGGEQRAMVRFRWSAGVEVLVPADCLEAIRCLAECMAKVGDHRGKAFQEVVVKA